MKKRYFHYDPFGDQIIRHETEEQARQAVTDLVNECHWADVEDELLLEIVWGEIKGDGESIARRGKP